MARCESQWVSLVLVALLSAAGGCSSAPERNEGGTAPTETAAENRPELEIRGADEIGADSIRDELSNQIEESYASGFRKSDVDDLAFEVERLYRERGFPFAAVTYDYSPNLAIIRIDEGTQVRVRGVEVDGNRVMADDQIAELLDLPRPKFGFGAPLYVESGLSSWADAIRDAYLERGYREVEVEKPETTFSEDQTEAFLRVTVHEGPQYVLRSIDLSGVDGLETISDQKTAEEEEATLRETLSYLEGSAWVDRLLYEVRGAMLDAYANAGYPEAEVSVHSSVTEGKENEEARRYVSLRVAGRPGPRVRIARVRVLGEDETSEDFIRGRSLVEAGSLYRGDLVRRTFRRLWGTGLFERVDVRLETPPGPTEPTPEGYELRDLVIEVAEGSTLQYFFELGFGSYDYLRAKAGVRERNILGRGLLGRAEILGSIRGGQVTLGLTDPWFLQSAWEADLPVSFSYRDEPAFTEMKGSLGLRFARQITDDLRFGVAERFSLSKVSDLVAEDELETPELRVSAFGPFLEFDSRDDVFEPTAGIRARIYGEAADPYIGSEISFVHSGFVVSGFFSPIEGTVLAASAQTDWIVPFSDTEAIPIQERLFGGGESSVRSFTQDELGPRDQEGDPLGGEVRNVLSFEIRQRVWGSFGVAAFADWGNVARDTSGAFEDFRPAVGPGLRYALPIGPARADFAFNPDARPDEDFFVFHFAIGLPF